MAIKTLKARTYEMAVSAFILGLLSFGLGPLSGIPAIICGQIVRHRIRRNPDFEGSGLALTGLILGYLFTILLIFAAASLISLLIWPPIVGSPEFERQ